MAYPVSVLRNLLSAGEGQSLEFKADVPPARALAETVCGFANAEGGVILIGVGPAGEILGCDEAIARRTLATARVSLTPRAEVEFDFASVGGKTVVVLIVGKSERMVRVAGSGPYIRNGTMTFRVDLGQAPERGLRRVAEATAYFLRVVG